jgi:hypothetical protein
MYKYQKIKNKVKDGDAIVVAHNILSQPHKIVVVKGEGIVLDGFWIYWNFFFEVNHPIECEIE